MFRVVLLVVAGVTLTGVTPPASGATPPAKKVCALSTRKACSAATPTPTFGNLPPVESLAVFIVQLPGFDQTPTPDDVQPFLDGPGYPQRGVLSLKDFYEKEAGVSYNRITVQPPMTMPDDMFARISPCDQMQLLADDYILALAYYPDLLSTYDQIMFFNSDQPDCLWNAGSLPEYGNLNQGVTVVNYNAEDPYVTARVIVHESGHAAFRLNHSRTRVDGVVHEYGSLGTIMSFDPTGLNIVDRRVIGSTAKRNVQTITKSGDYTICPRELLRPSCIQDLRVPMRDNEGYYASGTRAWMNVELNTETGPAPQVGVIVWDEQMHGVADQDWDVADLATANGSFVDPNGTVTVKSIGGQGAVVHIELPAGK